MRYLFIYFSNHACFWDADIDECALAAVTGLQACQGDVLCTNSPGSFACSCPTGYIMAPNGQSCVGEDGANVCPSWEGGEEGGGGCIQYEQKAVTMFAVLVPSPQT